MASEVSGPQGQRNAHAKMYNLGGNRREEPNKQNPWHKYCKEYATKNNISYAAAISLASPSWRAHKEKNGLTFRDRSRRVEREPEEESEPCEVAMHSSPPQKVPRKPKETFRKDHYKRQRPDGCGTQPHFQPYEEEEAEPRTQTPKKKRAKKEPYTHEDMDAFADFMRYRKMKTDGYE
jgi:hypothetical protein